MNTRTFRGFTLVEVMVAVIIIGILAAIAIPSYFAMTNRAKEGSVKSNAHSLRLGIEDFAVTTGGTYPALAEIDPSMFQGSVFPANPFTGALLSVVAPGFSQGDLGYVNAANSYTIEGYGHDATAGPGADGVVILLGN